MCCVVADFAQPAKVRFDVIPGSAPKFFVMHLNSGALFAFLAWLSDVLQAKPAQRIRVSNPCGGFWVGRHGSPCR